MVERRMVRVDGLVQGVGFRPHVHRVATELALGGLVRNDASGVVIEVEGDPRLLAAFPDRLKNGAPPLARIASLDSIPIPTLGTRDFVIEPSETGGRRRALVSADVGTCPSCAFEIDDPADRRFQYPFTNCTDCGPRFTIVRKMPYDRAHTTMAEFAMCDACRSEYHDSTGRRFHAQPIACPVCGPTLSFVGPDGPATGGEALRAAAAALARGRIVAIKGLGGYHLACDATSDGAVRRLRRRKGRDAKPLAVMVPDEAWLDRVVAPDHAARQLATGPQRPIVLFRRTDGTPVAGAVAPGCGYLGVMVPNTPLHTLLLEAVDRPLVMTSGNMSDEPIAYEDDDAQRRLDGIADAFLKHDRPIQTRCDDSVVRIVAERPSFVRRSRGYAPAPIALATDCSVPVLAVGGHLKNTLCLARGRQAFVSHHIGDLGTLEAVRGWRAAADHLRRLFEIDPEVIAHDLHPDYASTSLVDAWEPMARVPVQHHHAHVASVVAEHGLTEPVLGVAFDGAGLGTDGAVWGGEFLFVDGDRCDRLAHLGYVPLPGGDQAAREPWRMAAAHLRAAYGAVASAPIPLDAPDDPALSVVAQMMERGVNAPPTSSAGRLFDAVASLIGVRQTARFEAQAAMELEAIAAPTGSRTYGWDVSAMGDVTIVDTAPIVRGVVEDVRTGRPASEIAGVFHDTVTAMVVETVRALAANTGVRSVALTGGVFQNARLTESAADGLTTAGFAVYLQEQVPCNDGGLSLGQAHVARCRHGAV